MRERHAREARETVDLARKLEAVPQVARGASADEPGGWRLAYSLMEMDGSMSRIQQTLTRIRNEEVDPAELHGLLTDIGEELRHVLYHVKDSQFYEYLAAVE
jgi:hypothetical protein